MATLYKATALVPRIDEIEIYGSDVYLISFKEDKRITQKLGKDLSLKEAKPLLERYYQELGAKQGTSMAVVCGESLPWSRSLEGGESAFLLDKMFLGKTKFSKCLWESYRNSLPYDKEIINESQSMWVVK